MSTIDGMRIFQFPLPAQPIKIQSISECISNTPTTHQYDSHFSQPWEKLRKYRKRKVREPKLELPRVICTNRNVQQTTAEKKSKSQQQKSPTDGITIGISWRSTHRASTQSHKWNASAFAIPANHPLAHSVDERARVSIAMSSSDNLFNYTDGKRMKKCIKPPGRASLSISSQFRFPVPKLNQYGSLSGTVTRPLRPAHPSTATTHICTINNINKNRIHSAFYSFQMEWKLSHTGSLLPSHCIVLCWPREHPFGALLAYQNAAHILLVSD